MKHTKGPWVIGNGGPSEYTILSGDIHGQAISNSTLVACTEKCSEERANARLIAAAPELLEALKEFIECGPNAGHNKELILKAMAAITKAKGES